jgi:phosphoglycerate kinase
VSSYRTLDDLELARQRVLVRCDFNVPRDAEGRITDDTRIRAHLPTLRAILAAGGRPICLSHLGRPKGEVVNALRLAPIARRLEELLGSPVTALDESVGAAVAEKIEAAPAGTTLLLENVRFHAGETGGDDALARAFASLGDVFVNDAFGTCHRDHSSVCGIARHLPAAAGRLLESELKAFDKVLHEPERPFVAVLGGAKVSDKLGVVESLIERVDVLLVGGGMAYTFLAAQGLETGDSLLEPDRLETCAAALAKSRERGVELLLPVDHVIADRFAADAQARECEGAIPAGWMALDIGPRTRELFAARIVQARTVVWNGPMGVFEMERFRAGTEAVARAMAACEGTTVVGGGDSVAALSLLELEKSVTHVSTGGGASLELLEGKELPGIAALSPG